MDGKQCGFSLIEALVSLLVLSTGLLGLAQLQARLWSASGDLHTSTEAYLLANNALEQSTVAELMATDSTLVSGQEIPGSATAFIVTLGVTRQAQTTATSVRVAWETPGGPHSLTLTGTLYTNTRPSATRLLLPAR